MEKAIKETHNNKIKYLHFKGFGWAIARIRQVLSHYYYFDILLILFCIYLIMGLSVIIKEFKNIFHLYFFGR